MNPSYYFSVRYSIAGPLAGLIQASFPIPRLCCWKGTDRLTLCAVVPELIFHWNEQIKPELEKIFDKVNDLGDSGMILQFRDFCQALEVGNLVVLCTDRLQAEALFNCDQSELRELQAESPSAKDLIQATIRKRRNELMKELQGLQARYPDFPQIDGCIQALNA